MWMDNNASQNRELVAALSMDIVAEVAPEELDLFDDLVDEYYEDPSPPDMSASARDSALGFGLGGALAAATPAATAMVSAVLGLVVQVATQAFQDESSDFIRDKVKSLFGGKKVETTTDAPIPLTQDQLRRMREAALAEAQKFGMSGDEAERMADALFRRMAVSYTHLRAHET